MNTVKLCSRPKTSWGSNTSNCSISRGPPKCEKIPSDKYVPIPSVSAIRLQFLPSHPWAHAALRNTGRFDLKFKVQTRTLHARHIDSRFANTYFVYMLLAFLRMQLSR